MTNTRFRVNTPTVTHETIDGEAVIINLDSGSYYSLVDVGATVWQFLYQRAPVSEIVRPSQTPIQVTPRKSNVP